MKYIYYLLIPLTIFSCSSDESTEYKQMVIEYSGKLVAANEKQEFADLEIRQDYIEKVTDSLKDSPPILLIDNESLLSNNESIAQTIAIKNKQFIRYTTHP